MIAVRVDAVHSPNHTRKEAISQARLPGTGPPPESPDKPLCARLGGFSLHAATAVVEHDREGLERLCRYGLRVPFSQRRLSLLPDGRVRYDLARPWPTPSGADHLVLEPLAFLKRLAALLPAPYQRSVEKVQLAAGFQQKQRAREARAVNLVRYHGVFANRSRWRSLLPAPPSAPDEPAPQAALATVTDAEAQDLDADDEPPLDPEPDDEPALRSRRLPWARLLKRTLRVDGLDCPRCHAQMVLLALITRPSVIERILRHLRLPSTPPPLAPARDPREQAAQLEAALEHDPSGGADRDQPIARCSAPRAPP